MSPEEAFVTYLKTISGITDLVGTRIYFGDVPQETTTWPALIISVPEESQTAVMTGSGGQVVMTFDLEALSQDYLEAADVAEAIRYALQGYSGTMGSLTATSCHHETGSSAIYAAADGGKPMHGKQITYSIKFVVPIP